MNVSTRVLDLSSVIGVVALCPTLADVLSPKLFVAPLARPTAGKFPGQHLHCGGMNGEIVEQLQLVVGQATDS